MPEWFLPLLDPTQKKPGLHGEGFDIRPVGMDDMDALLELYRQCEDFLALGPDPHASVKMVANDLELSRASGGIFCGIFDPQNRLMGVLDVVTRGYEGDAARAFIELLMIGAPYRRAGLGARVMRAVEADLCRNPHLEVIALGVQDNNSIGLRFWQRQGYQPVGPPQSFPDGTTGIDHEKRLPRAFEYSAGLYHELRGRYAEQALEHIRERAQLTSDSSLLDLACGTGLVLQEFIHSAGALVGLDHSPDMLRQAQARFGSLPEVHLLRGDGHRLPFPSAQFDLITVGQAIHWFELELLLPEVQRTLKPGGWLAAISKYPDPRMPSSALRSRILEKYLPQTQAALRMTMVPAVGDLLGVERAGFGEYARSVFVGEVCTPLEAYAAGWAASSEANSLSESAREAYRDEILREFNPLAPDGRLRETYYNYVLMARKSSSDQRISDAH